MTSSVKIKMLIGLCLSSSIFFTQCKKEETLKLSEIATSQKLNGSLKNNLLAATTAPTGAYNIQNALPSGYVKDGSRDYTFYIQNAIDKYSEIAFPGFPIMINETGLKVKSNKRITFLSGSELRLKPTSSNNYNVIDIRSATNVTLVDPVVVGDREKHLSTTGEFGMGIGVRGSSNITLLNPIVTNCWGDGIYIGIDNQIGCKNVIITNGYTRNNRRDGISIISVDGLRMDNFYAGFNSGTTPQCGINFEPNTSKDELKNIVLNSPVTEGNPGYGIHMSISNLYGGNDKDIDIVVNNHVDKQSWKAIKWSCYNNQRVGNEVISAVVTYNNPMWKQHLETPLNTIKIALLESAQKLVINNPFIQTASGSTMSQTSVKSLLLNLIYRSPNYSLTFGEITPTPTPEPTPIPTNSTVFAVNAGGSEFTASNGIKYLADRNYSGGNTQRTSNSITNTIDDPLYNSERYGNFSYNIPVSDGIYEVTIKLTEIVKSTSGSRRFDVLFEGVQRLSDLDIYAAVGKYKAVDVVKTVEVTDGTLNILFKTDVYYAKLAAMHIIKK